MVVFAREDGVFLDQDLHVEVPGRSAPLPRLAFVGQADAVAGVDTRRDPYREGLLFLGPALAPTVDTMFLDHGALAAAPGTGLLYREDDLLHPHLAGAVAGGTGLGGGTGFGAAAAAELAFHQGRDADLDFFARDGFFQGQGEVIAQVGAAVHAPSPASPPTAEEVAEDVAEDVEATATEAPSPGPAESLARIHAGMAELVVGRALLGVVQDLVGLFGFLELALRFLPGIPIRVVFHGEASIGLFQIGVTGIAVDPEYLVVISFGHGLGTVH